MKMPKITCPNCAADLEVPDAPIHTCDYCGTAIQVSAMIGSGLTPTTRDREQLVIKDHFIIKCQYNQAQVKNLLVDWVKKIPGAPQDFEEAANISQNDLKFYPMWVGEYAATSDYVGIDNWPQFSRPAFDRPGWYEVVTYYKREESGHIIREYQKPLMAVDVQNLPIYLRDYVVTTTGKVYFDIQHVKKLGGVILDSIYKLEEAKTNLRQQVMGSQTAEMHKEVVQITRRTDDIQEKGVYYIHFPLYEIKFEYRGKLHDALVDGSNGRIVYVKVPVSVEFRAKSIAAIGGFGGIGALLIILGTLSVIGIIFGIGGGVGLIIIALMILGLNLRSKASEKQK
ncbi:MAG: hypothetical protein RBG13Loki_3852 [Promethearchaeota archaeon CR_4]|nr:MAG: hypothetical protein RBG13Loki_3852 [Candidatus Lokiarchaeota archaeon CR_4]